MGPKHAVKITGVGVMAHQAGVPSDSLSWAGAILPTALNAARGQFSKHT